MSSIDFGSSDNEEDPADMKKVVDLSTADTLLRHIQEIVDSPIRRRQMRDNSEPDEVEKVLILIDQSPVISLIQELRDVIELQSEQIMMLQRHMMSVR